MIEELPEFKDPICYIGVDLASTSDLTAVNYMIEQDGIFYNYTLYYLPERFKTISSYNRQKFLEWKKDGILLMTPGNVTDYDYILHDILENTKNYTIAGIWYDPYNATQFAINATEAGIPMFPYSQSVASFNKPTKEYERLMLSEKIKHLYSPITIFCIRNVQLKIDYNGNTKPVKKFTDENESGKIDGVIA